MKSELVMLDYFSVQKNILNLNLKTYFVTVFSNVVFSNILKKKKSEKKLLISFSSPACTPQTVKVALPHHSAFPNPLTQLSDAAVCVVQKTSKATRTSTNLINLSRMWRNVSDLEEKRNHNKNMTKNSPRLVGKVN